MFEQVFPPICLSWSFSGGLRGPVCEHDFRILLLELPLQVQVPELVSTINKKSVQGPILAGVGR